MKIALQIEPAGGAPPDVEYRWDPDTDILSAQLSPRADGDGLSGSVELEGADGSWLILDVAAGRINGVEVAVWPDVSKRDSLEPPTAIQDACVLLGSKRSKSGIAALEVETTLAAEADAAESVFHFTLGRSRQTRTLRLGRDLLLDVDGSSHLVGLWLLNVPPFPSSDT